MSKIDYIATENERVFEKFLQSNLKGIIIGFGIFIISSCQRLKTWKDLIVYLTILIIANTLYIIFINNKIKNDELNYSEEFKNKIRITADYILPLITILACAIEYIFKII